MKKYELNGFYITQGGYGFYVMAWDYEHEWVVHVTDTKIKAETWALNH